MNRFSRQTILPDFGKEGQEKLSRARVLVVGAGGLGCPVLLHLAAAGVGTIGIVDGDVISESNLNRQTLFGHQHTGKPKATTAAEILKQKYPDLNFEVFSDFLNTNNALEIISLFDVIVDGTDNFETKYLINDACILAGKPWIYASIYKNEGQLSVFNYEDGPSYRCLFPKTTRQNISCEATGVLGVVPGVFGMFQAMEALKIILGIGEVLSGKLKLLNLLSGSEQILKIQKKQEEIKKIKENGIIPVKIECNIRDESKLYLDIREIFEQPRINSEKVIKIPLSDLDDRMWEIPKEKEILVFCQSGKRSKKVVDLLKADYGFDNLKNVEGGIETIISNS